LVFDFNLNFEITHKINDLSLFLQIFFSKLHRSRHFAPSLPYRFSPSYTERSKWIITLAANGLTHSYLRKILGSICAEDFQHLTLYQPLTDQLIIQHR